MVCKAMYDAELYKEVEFIKYYEENAHNKANPGHDLVRQKMEAFVTWLKEDNESSSGSDSDSD